ncbi:hypothetical protein RB981_002706 [Vibrio cholerae]|uniref:insulinase family protein n=1 Tax=Vibrio cholerae TaxID=666 RepID=UPI00215D2B5B|nr:insulinase family protein [Vibrio cholerae]ELE7141938.1 hypothetical protein [Vibrio cholerae]MCR9707113.1 insulinase family protein [Vibrio cholerae]MCR9871744.1 insulinase family protein [Vibrio cholerae]
MFSRTTLPNGCTYSVIPYLNTAIASVNLWIRREGRFDLDHLCEHLIAYKLKRICKGKFPAVIGAKTTQDGYCLFARLPNKFIGEFIELAVSCFALDNQFINQKRVDEELAAISNELSSLSPKSKKINLDLGETPEHILNELTLDLVRSRLRQLLNGKRWLVEIVGAIQTVEQCRIEAVLNHSFEEKTEYLEQKKIQANDGALISVDRDSHMIGVRFDVSTPGQWDYHLMLIATRLLTGPFNTSLSSILRRKGLVYSIDRTFYISRGLGRHVLYIETNESGMSESIDLVTQYFSKNCEFTSSDVRTALEQSFLLQCIAVENVATLASRLGTHELCYGNPAPQKHLTTGFDSSNVERTMDLLANQYFNLNVEVLD